ncbi:MAG: glycosyltransferase family 39 protein [Acidobacteria bacterium]|nr:glycosyltransferase family 39 protein [Acidobacteriota bacterium]
MSTRGPALNFRRGLAVVFLLAAAVRVVGLDFDQNHFFHPDERAIGEAIVHLSFFPPQLNPHFFAYGSFPFYVTRAASSALAAVTRREWFASYDGVIHVGRFLSALWGALTCVLVALLGRRWYGEAAGLLAGGLLACSVLHVQTSHFAATDVALTFMVLLALVCDSRFANRGRARDALLAGAATGLALATKASAAPLLLPLALAAFLSVAASRRWGRGVSLAALAFAAALGAFALGEPYAFLDFREFWRSISEQGAMVRHAGLLPYTNQYVGVPHFLYEGKELVLWTLGPLLGLAALWATGSKLATFRRFRPGEWVVASFLVPYVLITCTFEVKFPRYLLPVYPILALWTAAWLTEKAAASRAGRILRAAVAAGAAVWTLAFLAIYTRPHSAVTASRWFHENVPEGTRVLEQDWDEGFPFSFPGSPAERYPIVMFGFYEPDSAAKIAKLAKELAAADRVVLQTKRLYGAVTRAPDKFPLTNRAFRLLFAGDLGFTLTRSFASRPALFGLELPDELADESLSVYDHPKILLFENREKLAADEIEARLLTRTPSRALSRGDLLLAEPAASPRPAAEAGPGPGLPGLRSEPAAIFLFAGFLELLGLAGYALLAAALPERPGLYALGKTCGVLFFAFGSWLLVSWRWAPFGRPLLLAWAAALGAGAWALARRRPFAAPAAERWKTELVAWGTFLFFLAFRAATPEIFSGEKPMDFAFLNALLRSTTLPPPEPWLAGSTLSYTYFGHYGLAAIGKLLGIHPGLLFNLGIAGVASLTACGVLAAGSALGGRLRAGAVAALLAMFAAPPSGVREAVLRWKAGQPLDWHYFWATSRVIGPNGISEYPLWTFLFADLHAHALAMPFTTAFLALLLFAATRDAVPTPREEAATIGLLGLLLAAIQITNGWAVPTYACALVFVPLAAYVVARPGGASASFAGFLRGVALPIAGAAAVAYGLARPFWAHFTPPPRNWGREVGPFASPWDFFNVWAFFLALLVPFVFTALRQGDPPPGRAARAARGILAALLPLSLLSLTLKPWHLDQAASIRGFTALACAAAAWAALRPGASREVRLACALAAFGFAVLTGCEVIYVWDRMNTIFKFHLEVWFFFAVAGAAAWRLLRTAGGPLWKSAAAIAFTAVLFTTVTAMPGYVRNGREDWPRATLDGTAYLESKAPGDRGAYEWINANVRGVPVVLEAQGDAYQDFSRYSMMTGLPTVLGWEYHTFQRGHSQPEIDRRKADVKAAYTALAPDEVAAVLRRYHVALVAVGPLERKTYGAGILARFGGWTDLLTPVYRNPEVTLFAVKGAFAPGASTPPLKVEELPARPAGAPAAQPAQQPAGQVRQPRGLASDAKGRVFVADFGNVRVQALKPDLSPLFSIGSLGSGPGEFRDPCAVAVDAKGVLYVADTWNGRIQVFDEKGVYQREFSSDFFGPRGVAVDAKGTVFVADTGNSRIVRFDVEGRKEAEWGREKGAGKLAEPQGLALGKDGLLYVADNGNGRVAVFAKDGSFVRAFDVAGWRRQVMSEPYLAVDASGRVWVSVPLDGEVRGYAPDGKLVATARGKDQPEGQRFEHPSGVALLPNGRLAVADFEGRLVVIDLPR